MIDPVAEQAAISGWAAGDRQAGAALLKMHAGMIVTCARRYVTDRCEEEDLAQEASIVMLRSVTTYDSSVGKFLSYAMRPMRWACAEYATLLRHDLHVSETAEEAARAMRDSSFKPSKEAAELLRRNRTKVALGTVRAVRLDAKIGEGDQTLLDLLAAPANDIHTGLDIVRMRQHVATLPIREQNILRRRCADDPETFAQIGVSMGVKKQRIEQIEKAAVALLRIRMMAA